MNWQTLLQQEVTATSRADVARRLGVSRTSVSLLVSGKYPGGTRRMVRRINTLLASERSHICPHTGEETAITECAKISAHVPTSSPAALRRWMTCRECAHNPHINKEQ